MHHATTPAKLFFRVQIILADISVDTLTGRQNSVYWQALQSINVFCASSILRMLNGAECEGLNRQNSEVWSREETEMTRASSSPSVFNLLVYPEICL